MSPAATDVIESLLAGKEPEGFARANVLCYTLPVKGPGHVLFAPAIVRIRRY
jgi:hypothetical protein